MKTATLPSIRVEPALRRKAEKLLGPGQTLSALLEDLVREGIGARASQAEFLDRSLAAEAEAERTGTWIPAAEVRLRLGRKLAQARAKARRR